MAASKLRSNEHEYSWMMITMDSAMTILWPRVATLLVIGSSTSNHFCGMCALALRTAEIRNYGIPSFEFLLRSCADHVAS